MLICSSTYKSYKDLEQDLYSGLPESGLRCPYSLKCTVLPKKIKIGKAEVFLLLLLLLLNFQRWKSLQNCYYYLLLIIIIITICISPFGIKHASGLRQLQIQIIKCQSKIKIKNIKIKITPNSKEKLGERTSFYHFHKYWEWVSNLPPWKVDVLIWKVTQEKTLSDILDR